MTLRGCLVNGLILLAFTIGGFLAAIPIVPSCVKTPEQRLQALEEEERRIEDRHPEWQDRHDGPLHLQKMCVDVDAALDTAAICLGATASGLLIGCVFLGARRALRKKYNQQHPPVAGKPGSG